MHIEINLPIKIVSELNVREHWTKKHARHRKLKRTLSLAFLPYINTNLLPCCVTLIRVSSRALDSDNLMGAFKSIRDYIADLLIPGLAMGRADSDARIMWVYMQEKGLPKQYACRIVIETP